MLLILLGIVGKIIGPRFIYDPGQVPDGNEAWYYLAVGALMLLNGLVSPALTAEEKKEAQKAEDAPAAAAPTRNPDTRPVVATTADKGDNA
jgi:hypothetical protein